MNDFNTTYMFGVNQGYGQIIGFKLTKDTTKSILRVPFTKPY